MNPPIAFTPEDTTKVFEYYFNAGNIDDLITAYYAKKAVLAATPGDAKEGNSLREALQQYFTLNGKMTATTRHKLVSEDTALLVIDWVVNYIDEKGNAAKYPGNSTDVVRRGTDGIWRCIIDNPH